MKLLFGENLSPWLAHNLADVFPGSVHVRDIGLSHGTDSEIWEYAKTNRLAIVTKDADFSERSIFDKKSPKVIWIRLGNCSAQRIETLMRSEFIAIRSHLESTSARCLTLGLR